jgi:anaerobic ribonucleoside-triphosphate reductase
MSYYDKDDNGNIITNTFYTEITKLHELLEESKIPHSYKPMYDGWQVCYPEEKNRIADAIEHSGSYASNVNRLEIMGLTTDGDDVEGNLTAEEVYSRFKKHYNDSIKA